MAVFDEPEVAAREHRIGLRRLVALQVRDTLKLLQRQLPEQATLGVLYMPLGTADELREQILALAVERAFLQSPPHDEASFEACVQQGRTRLALVAHEVARLTLQILTEWSAAQRKLKEARGLSGVTVADVQQQLQRLVGPRFVLDTPWAQLVHLPRYLKAVQMRLDKCRQDPARDQQRLAELQPLQQRVWRLLAERRGAPDERLTALRWMLEELRVSLFAQELRTPYPVSVKRLDKALAALQGS